MKNLHKYSKMLPVLVSVIALGTAAGLTIYAKNNNKLSGSFASASAPTSIPQNVFIIEADDAIVDKSNNIFIDTLTKKFYQQNGVKDTYDFINIFTTFHDPNKGAFHLTAKQNVTGIGDFVRDDSRFYGSQGKLLGINYFGNTFTRPNDPNTTPEAIRSSFHVMTHEMIHQWVLYIGDNNTFRTSDGTPHYGRFANSGFTRNGINFSDTNGGWFWRDNNNGTFSINFDVQRGISPLSLYLMGLVSPQETPSFQYLVPADPNNVTDSTIQATAQNVPISTFMSTYGQRSPSSGTSQKDFKVAYVLLKKRGEVLTKDQTEALKLISNEYPAEWNNQTWGKSRLIP